MLLNVFPIPRRYEKVPGALVSALAVVLVILHLSEHTALTLGLLSAGIVLVVLVYAVRFLQKREWRAFFEQENRRLLAIKGADGPARYIPEQRKVVQGLRHSELKLTAQLNLATALLTNCDEQEALELLDQVMPPEQMPNPTLRLVYWTQRLRAYLQTENEACADRAYQEALAAFPDVSDMLKISFMPSEIHYRLIKGEYETAINQLGELPVKDLDEAGQDLLQAYRVLALRGLGKEDKAEKLAAKLKTHDLLPSTRQLLL